MEKEKILVVFGGKSAEHDISIITGIQVLNKVDREKFDVFPLYLSRKGEMFFGKQLENLETYINFNEKAFKKATFLLGNKFLYLSKGKAFKRAFEVGCVINCCHGLNGEDGTLQGLFELCGIPQTSPSVLSSAICMDKTIMKDVLRANRILTPNSVSFSMFDFYFNQEEIFEKIQNNLNFPNNPCFVKPANLGSSIGISKCKNFQELEEAVEVAGKFDERIIVEESIENAVEVNCAVLGDGEFQIASKIEYPISWGKFLSFDEKYLMRKNAENLSENQKKLNEEIEEKIKEIAKNAFKVFNCKGVVRIDFLVKENEIYLNELNTIPGSLAFYLFKEEGIDFKGLLNRLITIAIKNNEEKQGKTFAYSSNALANFGAGNKTNKYAK